MITTQTPQHAYEERMVEESHQTANRDVFIASETAFPEKWVI